MKPTVPINLQSKLEMFSEHWSPKVVAAMNDVEFKLAKIKGDFVWHDHKDSDEVFFVIKGSMSIEMPDRSVHLTAGDMFVVPKGVSHRPYAKEECEIMLVEAKGVVNTGDIASELTAEYNTI